MIQSGGFVIGELPIFGIILNILPKKETDTGRNLGKYFLDRQIDKLNEEYIASEGLRRTLTNNETKNNVKVIKNSENRGIILKETTYKINSKNGECLIFLKP